MTSRPELEFEIYYGNAAVHGAKQTISPTDQYHLTAINPVRAAGHFYVNYVNLNSLET